MARKIARLTLDNLDDLPVACQSCVFWELDPVARQRAQGCGESRSEKEAWISHVLLEWGSCGRIAYVDGDPAGYVLYAPPVYLPGASAFPTAPVSGDAVLLATAFVHPEHADQGLGRVLMQSVAKDLLQRGGIRAIEAFGTSSPVRVEDQSRSGGTSAQCMVSADFLLHVGFKTHRGHPRYPRMRLELKSVLTWREEVEQALERLVGVVRPTRVRRPAPQHHRE